MFYLIISEIDKIMLFEPRQPPFIRVEHRAELAASELSRVYWNSPDLNAWLVHLKYHVLGVMREKHHKLQPKPKKTDELKATLLTIWEELL